MLYQVLNPQEVYRGDGETGIQVQGRWWPYSEVVTAPAAALATPINVTIPPDYLVYHIEKAAVNCAQTNTGYVEIVFGERNRKRIRLETILATQNDITRYIDEWLKAGQTLRIDVFLETGGPDAVAVTVHGRMFERQDKVIKGVAKPDLDLRTMTPM